MKRYNHPFDSSKHRIYLTLSQAADYLGVSISTMYKYNHRGLLPYYKGPKYVSYLKDDLDHFKQKGRVPSNDELTSSFE